MVLSTVSAERICSNFAGTTDPTFKRYVLLFKVSLHYKATHLIVHLADILALVTLVGHPTMDRGRYS